MAFYLTGIFTTANQLLIDLSTFANDNGWTVDYDGVYNTSYRRLHIHKGGAHYDLYSSSSTSFRVYGCTGYSVGSSPSDQPGVSDGYSPFTGENGGVFWLISVVGALYIGCVRGTEIHWGTLFAISDKIGNWTGGFGLQGSSSGGMFRYDAYGYTYGYAQLYFNDGWSAYNTAANGLGGSVYNSADMVIKCQPNIYNNGLLPFRIALFIFNSSDPEKKHPIGYAPGIYRSNGGDIYDIGDEITIGADAHIILPVRTYAIGSDTYGDFIFKLGA